jgi:hypothetical protein
MSRFANLAEKAENTPGPAQTELITTPGTAPHRSQGYLGLFLARTVHGAPPLRPQTRPQPASADG